MTTKHSHEAASDLLHSTYELGRYIRQHMMSHSQERLHMGQIHALVLIQEESGITMKKLAKMMHITSPSATTLIDRLVKLGYVSRRNDQENRRLVRLSLTPEGAAMLKEKMTERQKLLMKLFSSLSAEDVSELNRLVKKLLQHCSHS